MSISRKRMDKALSLFADAQKTKCENWQALWMASIACHESRWGEAFPKGSNNLIGYECPKAFRQRWSYCWATEGGTGNRVAYRIFSDLPDMFGKLLYLIKTSGHSKYVEARTSGPPDRQKWMRLFSEGYCPVDKNHGLKVIRIYGQIIKELEI